MAPNAVDTLPAIVVATTAGSSSSNALHDWLWYSLVDVNVVRVGECTWRWRGRMGSDLIRYRCVRLDRYVFVLLILLIRFRLLLMDSRR